MSATMPVPQPARPVAASGTNRQGSDLSRRQHAALAALLGSRTVAEAAREAHVGERTLRRWIAAPAFVAEMRRLQQSAVRDALGLIRSTSARAAARLGELVDSTDPAIALRAACAVLDLAQKLGEADLHARLDALERRSQMGGTR